MSFLKKIWKDTIAEYPNRRVLRDTITEVSQTVTVTRDIGTVTQEGDVFNASTMNDFENRVANGFKSVADVNEFTLPVENWLDSSVLVGSVITSDESEKYPKYARVITDKYNKDFVPQYIDVIPSGNFFSEDEEADKGILAQTVIFADDGFYAFAENTPSADVNLRIGGVV